MKLILIGCGAVGEVVGKILLERSSHMNWLDKVVFADYDIHKAQKLEKLFDASNVQAKAIELDASDKRAIMKAIEDNDIDTVFDGTVPYLANTVFDAAYDTGCHLLNMGTWSLPKGDISSPTDAYATYSEFMTSHNFQNHDKWKEKNLTGIICVGIDPGVVNVFAKFAAEHYFDTLKEIHVKDGCSIQHKDGQEGVVFGFNVWTVLDECLNPSVTWDKTTGFTAHPAFAGEEQFQFPDGVGLQKLYQIEHEEVVCMPKFLEPYGLEKCTYKIALDDNLVEALKVMNALGMRSLEPVKYKGQSVRPRDIVAAILPQPDSLNTDYEGKMCVGIHCVGIKNGLEREIFMYQSYDQQDAIDRFNSQAVVAQTALGASIAIELLATGAWKKPGVYSPEAFDPIPYMKAMQSFDFSYGLVELDSKYSAQINKEAMDNFML